MTKISTIEHNPIILKGFLNNPKWYAVGRLIQERYFTMRVYKYNILSGRISEVSIFPSTDEQLNLFVRTQNNAILSEFFWVVPEYNAR